ncbi:MerR family transcriptional regulator [Actinocrinis puniceicyclus]|uniref:MerR family transcriptional regulator n=1 Tax=Actinocrinis puniceicyclus TaxID=977794 RepID=UPI001B8C5AC5|nr:MerR family transcriptional regulator [Actinocrinis puniceicyclus]
MPQPAEPPALSPGATARRLGVAVETLRSWERRYGLGPSGHRPGAHRRYTPADVALLESFCLLVGEGVPAAEAARSARDTQHERRARAAQPPHAARDARSAPRTASTPGSALPSQAPQPDAPQPQPQPQPHARQRHTPRPQALGQRAPDSLDNPIRAARAGGGETLPIGRGGAPSARGLARCAIRLDTAAVLDLLERALARQGVVGAWQETIEPALRAVGRKWTETESRYVEVEHLLSWCATVALHRVRAPDPGGDDEARLSARGALLACAPGEWHSLPMEALAAALSERGAPVRMLGPAVPEAALRRAVERTAPARIVVWAQTSRTADTALLSRLALGRPAAVSPAGPGWSGHLPRGMRGLMSLAEAVAACCPRGGATTAGP